MKRTLEFVVEPSDILTIELNDIMGGGCKKVKNKCKKGETDITYDMAECEISTVSAW
ncbi:hypothetical protein [Odoribacter lunatus]|uniref:hypothetical protein n=1 Tax=Odoribacter lunatus TaxID=2941335 RepID=UPI00203AD280|nr:hypothetical protein [Odoribacter lunatus]